MILQSFVAIIFILFLIIVLLDGIDLLPISISFQNYLRIENNNEHIQGIQYLSLNLF